MYDSVVYNSIYREIKNAILEEYGISKHVEETTKMFIDVMCDEFNNTKWGGGMESEC